MSSRKNIMLIYFTILSFLISSVATDGTVNGVTSNRNIDRNHLDAAGVVGIIFACLAVVIGLALFIYCCCCTARPAVVPPVVTDSVVTMPVNTPVVTTAPAVEPIVIDNAHPVVPSPIIEPMPRPILPPPRPVVPRAMMMPQPVMPMPQPVVTELPVMPVGGVADFTQPIFTPGYM